MKVIFIDQYNSTSFLQSDADRVSSQNLENAKGFIESNHEKERLLTKIEYIFQDSLLRRYQEFPECQKLILKKWSVIFSQALSNAEVSRKDLLNLRCTKVAFQSLQQVITHIQPNGFNPYESSLSELPVSSARLFLKHLLQTPNAPPPPQNVLNAIFFKKNPQLLSEGRDEIQIILHELFKQKDHLSTFMMEFMVQQFLGILAFLEPAEQQPFSVPVYFNKQWIMADFKVQAIPISPVWTGKVEAYALVPTSVDSVANPMLLFRGTPNYTADGYFLSKITDFTPGVSVGGSLYYLGKEKLHAWMDEISKAFPNKQVHVIGNSLGGALAYHFAKNFPNQVVVSAFNPPGLFERSLYHNTKGVVYFHESDLICKLNYHPVSLKMIKIVTEEERGPLMAHMMPYGSKETIFLKVSSHMENQNLTRKIITIAHIIFSIPFLCFSILMNVLVSMSFYYTKKVKTSSKNLHPQVT